MMKHKTVKGFTLIELLVVIAILAILLAIVLVAINPQRQVQQANNTQRKSNVNAILNAVSQYSADNRGVLPVGIDATLRNISSTAGAGYVNLCSALVPTYMADLPVDPTVGAKGPTSSTVCTTAGATYTTGYGVTLQSGTGAGNRVTVSALSPELGATISATR